MKTIYKILVFIVLFKFIYCIDNYIFSNENWDLVFDSTNIVFTKVEFIDSSVGFACGYNYPIEKAILYKTINSGKNWFKIFETSKRFETCIYIKQVNKLLLSNENRYLYTSIDSGNSFDSLYGFGGFKKINLAGNNLVASTYYSTNYGTSWVNLNIHSSGIPSNYTHTVDDNGFMFVNDFIPNYLYRTRLVHFTNYGQNYNFVGGVFNNINIESVNYKNNFYMAGSYGGALLYSNNGINWNSIGLGGLILQKIEVTDSNYYILGLKQNAITVIKSKLNSLNFVTSLNLPNYQTLDFYDISFINNSTGFVAGFSKIYRTVNGGGNIVKIINEAKLLSYTLNQNYPNPFNPSTRFAYSLPVNANVTLKIYDMIGREVSVLVNQFNQAGSYIVDFNASNLASGIYFYKLEAFGVNGTTFSQTKRMVLIK